MTMQFGLEIITTNLEKNGGYRYGLDLKVVRDRCLLVMKAVWLVAGQSCLRQAFVGGEGRLACCRTGPHPEPRYGCLLKNNKSVLVCGQSKKEW